MPDHFSYLESQLDNLSLNNNSDFGLFSGKAGSCICHFLLSDISGNNAHLEKARALLDELSSDIARIESLEFASGLAGVGWGIEWLAQNKYIDINTDYILEDLDDELYKSVVYAKSPELSLENGTLGKLMYFYKRAMARNPDPIRYRVLCNHECLVLLSDELNEHLTRADGGLIAGDSGAAMQIPTAKALMETGESLMLLLKLSPLKINTECVDDLICRITQHIQHQIQTWEETANRANPEAYLYLLLAWKNAGLALNDQQWVAESISYYNQYQNRSSPRTAANPFQDNLLAKWRTGHMQDPAPGEIQFHRPISSIRDWVLTCSTLFHQANHALEEAFLLR